MSSFEGLRRYAVTLHTPRGEAVIEVPTYLGPEAAGRRAWLAGVQQRWGDVDEVVVTTVRRIRPDETCGPGISGSRTEKDSRTPEGAP